MLCGQFGSPIKCVQLIKEVWNMQLNGGKNDSWQNGFKALQRLYFPLGKHAFFRPTLYKQTIFTVYRSTFSTNNLSWLHVLCFLETQFCTSKSGNMANMRFVCSAHKSERTFTAGSNKFTARLSLRQTVTIKLQLQLT